ncbi:hypothetical protein J6590_017876 [Homalodisca vitripennis]|nr:hypothetical protein J6590_017876 [Homalodisca vitripennis]
MEIHTHSLTLNYLSERVKSPPALLSTPPFTCPTLFNISPAQLVKARRERSSWMLITKDFSRIKEEWESRTKESE